MKTLTVPLATALLAAGHAAAAPRPSLAEPSLSPDGREIVFVSGGDIWTVPSSGGTASLLITDPATEGRPLWSPDGKELAFTSTRNGSSNLYVLNLATSQVRRLTWSDASDQLDAWSRDGKWLYFSSSAGDLSRQNDIYRVAASGGTPLEVSRERYLNEFNAAPSPDGKTLALMAKGMSSQQWWRNGHSHIDEAELWLKPVASDAPYRKLTGAGAKRLWPMWRPDGQALYLMSDESGAENLWSLPIEEGKAATKVTGFTSGRVLYPSISYDGRAIVFERELAIWKLDTATGEAAEVPISLRGSPAASGERRINETVFRAMAVSPDGKKVALIAHGEVFATSASEGGPSVRITETIGEEGDLNWSPDSKKLAYVSERGLGSLIAEYDFATQKERALTKATDVDAAPVYSPDGKLLAYMHGPHELHVIALGDGKTAVKDAKIFTGALDRDDATRVTWSPDSKWIAFPVTDRKSFRNVWVIPAAGGEAKQVTFFANGKTGERTAWSPDGKYLVFETSQRSEGRQLVRVDLLPHTPKYREDAFRDLFDDKKPPADSTSTDDKSAPKPGDATAKNTKDAKPKIDPVKIVFEGIRERATFLPLGGLSADEPVISPDGKLLLFRAGSSDEQVYSYSLDELAKEPPSPVQISQGRKPKRDHAFSADSKQVYFLDGGHITSTPLENPKLKVTEASAEMVVRFDAEKQVVFDQAWFALNRAFYDPTFHGQDWKALRARFEPFVQGSQTADELRRIINLMIGELNASHLGLYSPREGFGAPPAPRVGDLGLRFDRDAYEAGRGLVVREVVKLGPAFIEGSIKAGDTLAAVDGRPVGAGVNLDSLLVDRAGKRTVLTVASGGKKRDAVVRPVSSGVAAGLLYRDWVNERRAIVEKLSGGRLGYVHLFDMSSNSLNQLYIDLDAQNQGREGVVIDVRNNNGGFVNGYVLDVFSRKNFLTMTPRELFAVPSRQNLGQRALGLPTILVTNESSLSDAEDFTEGYRTLALGKVVGTPTAGWIIYTHNLTLIDGSNLRVPSTRIEGADGQNMEGNPRKVDLEVVRQLGETMAGKDSQLEAASSTLLKQLKP
jgi:Tol biopolymer transport system component/C-terminal processing protease CtpA/Prc